tara:strand:+ start:154 stop:528 length:375 start_codon:yes stop_codon:yes gene_type:complete
MGATWHYVTRTLPGIGVVLTVYDAYGNEIDEVIEDTADKAFEKAKDLAEAAGASLEAAGRAIANATLDVVRGLGSAIIEGLDNAFDAVGEKLSGKEPAVIAGLTTATIGLLTVILLFHTAKKGL